MRLEEGSHVQIGNVQPFLYWSQRPLSYVDANGKNLYASKVIKQLEKQLAASSSSTVQHQDYILKQCKCLASVLSGDRAGTFPLDRGIFFSHTIPLGANPYLPFYQLKQQQGSEVAQRCIVCPDEVDVDLSNFSCCFLSYEEFIPDFGKPRCPCCNSNSKVHRHGWATSTKRVFSLWRNLVIFSALYVCKKCHKNGGQDRVFSSHDRNVLQQLPDWFRFGLPFVVTDAGSYVDRETMFLVESIGHILGPSALNQMSGEVNTRRFNNEEKVRFSFHAEVTRLKTVPRLKAMAMLAPAPMPELAALAQVYPPKPRVMRERLKDGSGPRRFAPTSNAFYTDLIVNGDGDRAEWQQDYQLTIYDPVGAYATDHNHVNAAKIKGADGKSIYMGHASAMCSSTEQLVFCKPVASTSLKEVETDWKDLNERSLASGGPGVQVIWCDDPPKQGPSYRRFVGKTLKQVLADIMHVMNRYLRVMGRKHPLRGAAMADLSEYIFIIIEESKQTLMEELIASEKYTREQAEALPFKFWRRRCECKVPAKEILKLQLEAWWHKWKDKIDGLGNPLFLEGAQEVHNNQIKLVESGAMSDPTFLKMYRSLGKQLRALRGTSRLEGFHRWFNRMVKGSTYSEELWDAIIRDFLHTWNVHAGWRYTGLVNYGTTDWRDLEYMKKVALSAQASDPAWQDPFPNLMVVPRGKLQQAPGKQRAELDDDSEEKKYAPEVDEEDPFDQCVVDSMAELDNLEERVLQDEDDVEGAAGTLLEEEGPSDPVVCSSGPSSEPMQEGLQLGKQVDPAPDNVPCDDETAPIVLGGNSSSSSEDEGQGAPQQPGGLFAASMLPLDAPDLCTPGCPMCKAPSHYSRSEGGRKVCRQCGTVLPERPTAGAGDGGMPFAHVHNAMSEGACRDQGLPEAVLGMDEDCAEADALPVTGGRRAAAGRRSHGSGRRGGAAGKEAVADGIKKQVCDTVLRRTRRSKRKLKYSQLFASVTRPEEQKLFVQLFEEYTSPATGHTSWDAMCRRWNEIVADALLAVDNTSHTAADLPYLLKRPAHLKKHATKLADAAEFIHSLKLSAAQARISAFMVLEAKPGEKRTREGDSMQPEATSVSQGPPQQHQQQQQDAASGPVGVVPCPPLLSSSREPQKQHQQQQQQVPGPPFLFSSREPQKQQLVPGPPLLPFSRELHQHEPLPPPPSQPRTATATLPPSPQAYQQGLCRMPTMLGGGLSLTFNQQQQQVKQHSRNSLAAAAGATTLPHQSVIQQRREHCSSAAGIDAPMTRSGDYQQKEQHPGLFASGMGAFSPMYGGYQQPGRQQQQPACLFAPSPLSSIPPIIEQPGGMHGQAQQHMKVPPASYKLDIGTSVEANGFLPPQLASSKFIQQCTYKGQQQQQSSMRLLQGMHRASGAVRGGGTTTAKPERQKPSCQFCRLIKKQTVYMEGGHNKVCIFQRALQEGARQTNKTSLAWLHNVLLAVAGKTLFTVCSSQKPADREKYEEFKGEGYDLRACVPGYATDFHGSLPADVSAKVLPAAAVNAAGGGGAPLGQQQQEEDKEL